MVASRGSGALLVRPRGGAGGARWKGRLVAVEELDPSKGMPTEPAGALRIGRLLVAAENLDFGFSRASGPGGQNVNKVSSRVELRVRLAELGLYEGEMLRLRAIAGRKVLEDGTLQLFCQESRSQLDNRRLVLERLTELLTEAQKAPRVRRKTKPTGGSKRRRLAEKKRRGDVKKNRGSGGGDGGDE